MQGGVPYAPGDDRVVDLGQADSKPAPLKTTRDAAPKLASPCNLCPHPPVVDLHEADSKPAPLKTTRDAAPKPASPCDLCPTRPKDWPWSSGSFYANGAGMIAIDVRHEETAEKTRTLRPRGAAPTSTLTR